ncbi:ComEC/Rec2 family competence protein [Epilithonimonas tenax]|uniref:ComEC/Rec2 family competence protein n=1 Tax=Epilithonimonas tenax TaxID=191577 RepID=UPI00047FFBCB|nr:ComEC/Rec2 family competence protein [Epilithonimonas tenax]
MKKQPLLILLLCFVLGIVLREYVLFSKIIGFGLVILSGAFLFTILMRKVFFQRIKYYVLGFFFFSIGLFVHSQHSEKSALPTLKSKENVVFQLDKKLNSNDKNRRYIVEILAIPSNESQLFSPIKTVLSMPKDQGLLDFNHFYDAEVYIHQPESIHHDFQFDYKKYLARQQVFLQAYLPNGILKTVKTEVSFSDQIRQKRLEILNQINQTSLSPKIQEFLKGIILSDRTDMDKDTVKDFNQTGLVHLLAISGSHMVIIFWITLFVFNQMTPVRFRKIAIVLSLILIWIFAVFIDYGSSVMRSCLMISCYYVMVLLQRKSDLLHSLSLSAFILLIVDSNQFFDVGFQLSYVAVLGIWWLSEPIKKLLRKPKYWLEDFIYSITAMTFSAQIATLPLAIYYFHQFSLVSIFANLLIIPLSEIMIVSSLIMVIAIAFGMKYLLVFQVFDAFILYVLKAIHWFSSFESLMNKNIPLSILEVGVLLLGIYFLKFLIKDFFNIKYVLRLSVCLLLFFGLRIGFNIYNYEKSEVLVHHFYKEKIISVKNKDQIVFWLKEQRNQEKMIDFVVNPYLVSRRISNYEIKYYPDDADAFVFEGTKYHLK